MTGMERVPMGPPWSVDLIADLHAGVLPPEVAAQLRPRVEADAEASEVLRALDATLEDLHSLPPVPMPDHVAARIDAALAAEARPGIAPVVSLSDARRRRNRRLGMGGGVLVAAAAAFGIVLAVSPGAQQPPANDAAPAPTSKQSEAPPLALKRDELGSAVGEVLGAQNYGPLETPDRLTGCLKGGGITSSGTPLGISPIDLEGRSAVMAILPAGLGKYRLVVLDPATCGPDRQEGVLADTTVGQR
ncbi:hypothetical protein SAMN04488074_106160 [Lentzea albidocapillata subsp. violacea]|uniref:Anti-sigma-M factor RsmA n=1 Tax=Lentzea albidocapillata subsp. violacea TaxID=128104 RepID=A0A1G9D6Z8_9PSEU|nr:hypothetical protein [Lentzea albidocapillata]SDK59692.1 hypothetical protein SAMN04488074_106160 [Lentzea albidocapillata subsp. violacea]